MNEAESCSLEIRRGGLVREDDDFDLNKGINRINNSKTIKLYQFESKLLFPFFFFIVKLSAKRNPP